jgi:hypothetical protein
MRNWFIAAAIVAVMISGVAWAAVETLQRRVVMYHVLWNLS